jgi:hypothetical protein
MITLEEKYHKGSVNLQPAELLARFVSDPEVKSEQTPEIARDFIVALSANLTGGKYGDLHDTFLDNCYYRDLLVMSPDMRTLHGFDNVLDYFNISSRVFKSVSMDSQRKPELAPLDAGRTIISIIVHLVAETDIAKVRGLAKLVQDAHDGGKWKVFIFHTVVTSWIGLPEETIGAHRPFGGELTPTKQDKKPGQLVADDPAVLIVGSTSQAFPP